MIFCRKSKLSFIYSILERLLESFWRKAEVCARRQVGSPIYHCRDYHLFYIEFCMFLTPLPQTFSYVPYELFFSIIMAPGGGHLCHTDTLLVASELLRSAVAGRLYKHHSKHTSNSGFDRSFMPCSGYILFAAEQRVGYQISWVDLQREVNCP